MGILDFPSRGKGPAERSVAGLAKALDGFSIEVMPRTAAKVPSFPDILPAGTWIYIANIDGTPFDDIEGTSRSRNVVVEFPSLEEARACYNSPEYQQGLAFRKASAVADVIIIEGYDGQQPGEPPRN